MEKSSLENLRLQERKLRVSIIIPVYNEQEVLPEFHSRLSRVVDDQPQYHFEAIYVNDGSSDQTLAVLQKMMASDCRVQILNLSRNFGKEAGMTAGIDHCSGDAVIVIDADLQDPPELIPQMLQAWTAGNDMVCMQRLSRDGESAVKKATAKAFYALMKHVGTTPIPENVGDFRLMSRAAVNALKQVPERTRFMKGLFTWVGFQTCLLPYHREARCAGVTKWNYWKLWNLALEGLTSFTVAPLKIASYVGILTSFVAFCYGAVIMIKTLVFGDPVPGYPSLMVVVLFLGGVQLLAIGILGEYLGRVFIETKNRPLYLIQDHLKEKEQSRVNSITPHFPKKELSHG